ncbi:MAG: prolyl oligopeptidase family serine peptidase [Xanthomonadales bacterium]|nr:prolyl oligopeptidase family serine peptidase [Xanthomonadales bacterium]
MDGFQLFREHLVVAERSEGLRRLRVRPLEGESWLIAAEEPAYTMALGDNREQDSHRIRYLYTSLTTPLSVYELDLRSGERALLKQEPVLGDFSPANYVTERLWVPARDGERIPVSLVYRKGFRRDGSAPLYLTAYGAYGASRDPSFSAARLSLLDRGFVFALAHVRGGQELGRRWYEGGRLLNKMNTFTDFIDVTEHLVREGYAAKDKVFAAGGSAGGLLIGAVANLAPQLYAGMAAHVPFVDVVTTMLDESIPLTTNEFDEWGNPKERQYYEYMLGYSPYDNVRPQPYPPLFVTTGLWDSQVQYWEPAKWVAKLRAMRSERRADRVPGADGGRPRRPFRALPAAARDRRGIRVLPPPRRPARVRALTSPGA